MAAAAERAGALQAVVFDFDGVLVNSEPLHLRAYQDVLRPEGIALSAREYVAQYLGYDDEAVFAAVARAHGRGSDGRWVAAMIDRKSDAMQRLLADETPLFDGAAEQVRSIAALVPVAIASGALRHEILQVLRRVGLADLFTTIVAAGETARGKPAPDPYAEAVRRMADATGTALEPSRVVAVEDSVQGVTSAVAAGLRTVAVTTTYDAGALADAEVIVSDISALSIEDLSALCGQPRGRPGPGGG